MSAGRRPYSSIAVSSVSSTNFSADLADPPRYWRAMIRRAPSKCSSPHWLGRRSLSSKGTRRTRSSCSTKKPVHSAAIAATPRTARLEFSRQQAGFADERCPVVSQNGSARRLVQIRRLRSASSRLRLRVPSVSAILRLAASSVLMVNRADRILDNLATATITAGGASGVFMVLMGLILSSEVTAGGSRHSAIAPHDRARSAEPRYRPCRSIRIPSRPLPAAWRPEGSIHQRSFPPDAS